MAVNISAVQLHDPRLPETLLGILGDHGLSAGTPRGGDHRVALIKGR